MKSNPKAWECFRNTKGSADHIRELYDFFDEQGIKVFTVPVRPSFGWVIVDTSKDTAIDASNEIITTRTEAEEQAFLRAFQLLEEKLKEGR